MRQIFLAPYFRPDLVVIGPGQRDPTQGFNQAEISQLYWNLQEAASAGASLVVLPEMWNCPYSNDSFPTFAEDIDANASPSADALAEAAAANAITLVGGSIPEKSNNRLYNTCLVFSREGTLLAKHRKVPLPTSPYFSSLEDMLQLTLGRYMAPCLLEHVAALA